MTRWNVVVSEETDRELRAFLAEEGETRKGALSRFIEEAVLRCLQERKLKADSRTLHDQKAMGEAIMERYQEELWQAYESMM